MFTTEQHYVAKQSKKRDKGVFYDGTAFVHEAGMKKQFTYRNLVLVLGVVVAIIIAVALWNNKQSPESSSKLVLDTPLMYPITQVIQKAVAKVFF